MVIDGDFFVILRTNKKIGCLIRFLRNMQNMPTVTKNLLLINCLAFLAGFVFPGMASLGGLHFFLASNFNIFQFITYQFLHSGLTHIFFNMFALWMFGRIMESVWGPKKFLFYYLSCGVGAGLIQEVAQFFEFYYIIQAQMPSVSFGELFAIGHQEAQALNAWKTIGASGSVYGILLAFGMTFPNERMFIFPLPIPIKAKWLVIGYAAFELYLAYSSSGDGVAHMAHLGGMLFGFFMIRYWNKQNSFNRSGGQDFFDNLKRNFEQRMKKPEYKNPNMHAEQGGSKESDWEYNARKKANQEEIDRILDKIRKSGYDSLTQEEKKTLFDSSNNI